MSTPERRVATHTARRPPLDHHRRVIAHSPCVDASSDYFGAAGTVSELVVVSCRTPSPSPNPRSAPAIPTGYTRRTVSSTVSRTGGPPVVVRHAIRAAPLAKQATVAQTMGHDKLVLRHPATTVARTLAQNRIGKNTRPSRPSRSSNGIDERYRQNVRQATAATRRPATTAELA